MTGKLDIAKRVYSAYNDRSKIAYINAITSAKKKESLLEGLEGQDRIEANMLLEEESVLQPILR